MFPNKRSSRSYFVTLSQYNRFRNVESRGSESSSDSFRSELSETVTSFPNPTTTTHQDSPFLYHFDEISCAIRDPLSDHLSSSSWICTLREQKAIVLRRRLLDGEILQSALSSISGIRHPSLATLLGAALNDDHIFIIYECIADSATLKQCLNSSSFSNWVSRLQVALDVSMGLEYIHRDCDTVHAMISSSSIIVTEPSFNAKIVLFGAASDPATSADDEDVEMRAKRLAGDLFSIEEPTGYVAPEVLAGGGRMSRESDVFALGMLILELVSGKIPLEYRMNKMSLKCERISVIETAKHAVGSDGDKLETEERKRRIRMWVDQKLVNPFPDGVAEELIRLGLLCVEEDPSMRPEVASVTETIAKLLQDSIAWEQRGKEPSTSKTSNNSSTSGTGSGYSIDDVCPEGWILAPNLRAFSFKELRSATNNFEPARLVGEGGFGRVFMGWVDEKTLNPAKSGLCIAVKKLSPWSFRGLKEWKSEVNILRRLSHPNIVKLLGYCSERFELLLVHEFMTKGSLDNHLYRTVEDFEPLSWSLRLKIVLGAARGLAFLHEMQIIYRDFKTSNILLDSNYNPKLCNFRLAMYGPAGGDSHLTTQLAGTFGYMGPEYMATGRINVKSDVYGFGVVLLEILSGLRTIDMVLSEEPFNNMDNTGDWAKSFLADHKKVLRLINNMGDWAKSFLADHKKVLRLIDPRLNGQYQFNEAFLLAILALRCLASDPKIRPSMEEVVESLEQIEARKSWYMQS